MVRRKRSVWVERPQGSKNYLISWYDREGRRRRITIGPDRKEAEVAALQKQAELNDPAAPRREPVPLDGFIEQYLAVARTRLQPSSIAEAQRSLRRFARFVGERVPVDQITGRDMERYMAARAGEGLQIPSVNREFRTIKAALGVAARWGYVTENPLRSVKQWREVKRDIRVLTTDEVERLLAAAPSITWRAFIALAVTSGLRKSELSYLEWDDLDLENGLVHVRSKPENHVKSGRDRAVGLAPRAAELLRALRAEAQQRGLISRWVFTTRNGGPLAHNLNRPFSSIVRRAQIAHCTIHDLRRTFCSHLAMAGVSAAVVQQAAGHASIATTQKYYIRVEQAALVDAVRRLPFGAAEVKEKTA